MDPPEEDFALASAHQLIHRYDIREKIKTANKELFESMSVDDMLETVVEGGRRVTFKAHLEEFGPDAQVTSASDDEEDVVEEIEIVDAFDLDSVAQEIDGIEADLVERPVLKDISKDEQSSSPPITPDVSVPASPAKKVVALTVKKIPSHTAHDDHGHKYKSCCKSMAPGAKKLPKYNGAVSEYGLTREQLTKRLDRARHNERLRQRNAFGLYRLAQERDRVNEEAFASWLQGKMAKAMQNKYRNRFDD